MYILYYLSFLTHFFSEEYPKLSCNFLLYIYNWITVHWAFSNLTLVLHYHKVGTRVSYRVSNVIDYSLTRNYAQLRKIIFILCNFAGLHVIGETSVSRNYGVISRNFVIITRNQRNFNFAKLRCNFA